MKIVVLDDWSGAFRDVTAHARLEGHEVVIYSDTVKEPAQLAARLHDADAIVITQARRSRRSARASA